MKKQTKKNLHPNVPTPHNSAKYNDIVKRVIMPGDPKRATWIAKTFLKNVKLVNEVRGMLAYTGTYKNVPVTVMAHGMGIPSVCIYTHELFNFYGVKVIYRIGSCGVMKAAKAKLGDVIVVKSGWSDIPTTEWLGVKPDAKNLFYPTKSCLDLIIKTAKQHKIPYHLLNVSCDSYFYNNLSAAQIYAKTKAPAVEMESFGLFAEAKLAKKRAACILTVSDNIETHESMDAEARQTTFKNMVKLGLESIIKEKI